MKLLRLQASRLSPAQQHNQVSAEGRPPGVSVFTRSSAPLRAKQPGWRLAGLLGPISPREGLCV